MKPRPITEADVAYFGDQEPRVVTFNAPEDMPDCEPVEGMFAHHPSGGVVVRIPWVPDEIELAHLAQGGAVWLSTWGGLPPHMLEVSAPPDRTTA